MAIKRDTTSSDGELLFPSLMPHYDSLVYHIRHPKYHNDTGKIFIDDQNVDRNVHLTVDLAFKVSKEFDQKFLPSDSLYLQGYGVTGINSHGYAVYQNVEPTDSLFYRIDCPQYNVDSGYVSALYSDTLSKNLKHTRYDVTFHLSYNDSPLSGLQVELADQPALQTNESGKVTFEQILPDTLGYTIDHPEYLEKTGHFALSSNDTTIDLQVLPVYNLDFIVESGSLSGNIYVDQATVKLMPLDSVATTNSFGEATFEQVTPHDSIFYQVNAQGYYDTTGVVQVKNSDVRQKVTLELKPTLEATNLITPNGDGKNDYWIIYHAERYDAFQVSIYSPNGEKVYSTKNYSENKWNGKYHGEKLPDGVYYYIIRNPSGKTVFTGTINLVN
jgi:gliding motility-associated-like protein